MLTGLTHSNCAPACLLCRLFPILGLIGVRQILIIKQNSLSLSFAKILARALENTHPFSLAFSRLLSFLSLSLSLFCTHTKPNSSRRQTTTALEITYLEMSSRCRHENLKRKTASSLLAIALSPQIGQFPQVKLTQKQSSSPSGVLLEQQTRLTLTSRQQASS